MKAIEMAKVVDIATGYEFDLGCSPTGLIFEDGEMYQYDNTFEGNLSKNKMYRFIDAEGIEDICTIEELFCCKDLDDYEKPELRK